LSRTANRKSSSANRQSAQPPIDVAFDEELANWLAGRESYNKHLYRPTSYLHKWWARRCGTTFRLILKGLVSDQQRRDYYQAGGLEGTIILDPMLGGGTTLHEAIRLGASVIGADIDPIPILQARAALTDVPLERLESAFATLFQGLSRRLGPLMMAGCPACQARSPVRFTLYGRKAVCGCGSVLLVDSLLLRASRLGIEACLCPGCAAVYSSGHDCPRAGCAPIIRQRSGATCPACRQPYCWPTDLPFFARYSPIAVATRCAEHGLALGRPQAVDHELVRPGGEEHPPLTLGATADFAIGPGPKSGDLLRLGVTSYLELFSPRQLIYLDEAIRQVAAADPVTHLTLALLISTSLEFNSMLCGYKGAAARRPGAIRHAFSLHAYSIPYTALENNPVFPEPASGTLLKLFHDRVRRARRWAAAPRERRLVNGRAETVVIAAERDSGQEVCGVAELSAGAGRFWLQQGTSARLALADGSVDFVVTDPPYFDSVQYGDLAAYFRVWLRRLLPGATEWDYDLKQTAVGGPNGQGGDHYTSMLAAIFAECRRVLRRPSGRLIFTFHHLKPQGWAALTIALSRAGFRLVNRYVVHAENPRSVHIAGQRALTHDAILVLAPADSAPGRQWTPPAGISSWESSRFSRDCATLLGALLEADVTEPEIERRWRAAIDV
jgi:DNA modification methylase